MTRVILGQPIDLLVTSKKDMTSTYILHLSREDILALHRILEDVCKGKVEGYKWRTREQRKQSNMLYQAVADVLYSDRRTT